MAVANPSGHAHVASSSGNAGVSNHAQAAAVFQEHLGGVTEARSSRVRFDMRLVPARSSLDSGWGGGPSNPSRQSPIVYLREREAGVDAMLC